MELPQFKAHYKNPPVLTTSALSSFAKCPRHWFYRHGCNLVGRGVSVPMKFGEAIHKAMDFIVIPERANYDNAMSAFMSIWEPALQKGMLEDDKRNRTIAKLIILDLIERHKPGRSIYNVCEPPESLLKVTSRQSSLEVPFAVAIPGVSRPLASRVDSIAKHRDSGAWWGVEYKTCSEISDRLAKSFDMNVQVFSYTLGLRNGGLNVPGMFVPLIFVGKSKQEVLTKVVHVHEHHLDSFVRWVAFIGHMIELCEQNEDFIQQFSGCSTYGTWGIPGRVCEYEPLCSTENWTDLLSLYTQSTYEPFKLVEQKCDPHIGLLTWKDTKLLELDSLPSEAINEESVSNS